MPLIFAIILIISSFSAAQPGSSLFVRLNQAGYLPGDIKSAVLFSKRPLPDNKFFILNDKGKVIFAGSVTRSGLKYGRFGYTGTADFSNLKAEGKYRFRIKGSKDLAFVIGENIYNSVADSLLLFFRVQRCGPTDPLLHEPCHLSDATRIEGISDSLVDVTGGWHDAGDYIKFLSTASYTTYMLIFSYEFDPVKFGFDNNENSVPDILEEARVGLDWLLRCHIRDNLLVTQVQDLRDHQASWRLPEKDSLQYDRPAYTGLGKNIIGIYTAALSIGARIWSSKFYDYDFASLCLGTAEDVYALHRDAPGVDSVNASVYQDGDFNGKMALGSAELYLSTGKEDYLQNARYFAAEAGSDYWWSWGNINTLAHYRLAGMGEDNTGYILNNLDHFNSRKDSSLFNESISFTWGTTNSMLGAALQAILYKALTGDDRFDSLAAFQRDYVLGRNPWGLSFIYGFGTDYPRNLHSQIAFFRRGYLPGGLAAGPAPLELTRKYRIARNNKKYDYFNTPAGVYYDDHNDYITNEPTITGNATALFVYGYYSKRGM